MARHYSFRERQRGAVALIVGLLSVLVLFGMMGIAIDLSYLYARKTELQNAADAAALSGAKRLNHTAAGVTNAVNDAIQTFSLNATSNLIAGESITIANIRLANCPNASDHLPLRAPTCTFVPASTVTTDALASGLTFLEVSTGAASNKPVFFMPVMGGPESASTHGYAVAGHYVTQITPIGVCAIVPYPGGAGSPQVRTSKYTYPDNSTELVELGFRRGVSYNIVELNPLGASGVPFLINPVDAPPSACDPNHSSADFTAPFVCQGNSAVVGDVLGTTTQVYVNTGFSSGPIERALNSRFDFFPNSSPCSPTTSPPDVNIRQYTYNNGGTGRPRDWTEGSGNSLPERQSVRVSSFVPVYSQPPAQPGASFADYGALWSYARPYQVDGSTPPKADLDNYVGATNVNWQKLYNSGAAGDLLNESVYPGSAGANFPQGTPASPYNQFDYSNPSSSSSVFFQRPVNSGRIGRRVLNIVIVDCSSLGSGGLSCAPLTVRGVGRFFMQVPADLNGSPKKIEGEFAGLIETPLPGEIKLYR